jgi:hypothetical protein
MAEPAIQDFPRKVQGVPFETAHPESPDVIRHLSRRIDCTPSDGKSRNGNPHPDLPARERGKRV